MEEERVAAKAAAKNEPHQNSDIYCIKCNNFTPNANPHIVQGQSYQLKALCVVCNSKKNRFLKSRNHNKKEKTHKSKRRQNIFENSKEEVGIAPAMAKDRLEGLEDLDENMI